MRPREVELLLGGADDGELDDAAHTGGFRGADDVGLAFGLAHRAGAEQEYRLDAVERGAQCVRLGIIDRHRIATGGSGPPALSGEW